MFTRNYFSNHNILATRTVGGEERALGQYRRISEKRDTKCAASKQSCSWRKAWLGSPNLNVIPSAHREIAYQTLEKLIRGGISAGSWKLGLSADLRSFSFSLFFPPPFSVSLSVYVCDDSRSIGRVNYLRDVTTRLPWSQRSSLERNNFRQSFIFIIIIFSLLSFFPTPFYITIQ